MTRALLILFFCLTLASCGTPEERVESYLESAQELFDTEQYESARLDVSNALQIEPKNARARVLLAKIAINEGEIGDAFESLRLAAELDPALLEARILLGEIYYLAKMVDEIEAQVTVAEQIAPGDPEVLLLRSRVLALGDDTAGALDKIDAALAVAPELESVVIFKASLLATSGDPDAGIAFLDEHIARMETAETERIRNFRIVLLGIAGREAEIESALRSLAQDFPEQDKYAADLARRFIQADRVDDAEQVMREMASRDDDSYTKRLGLVSFLATQRSADAAEDVIKHFVEESPESGELRLMLGNLYDSEGQLDDALLVYGQVVDVAPASDEAFVARNRIASIQVRQGKPDEARATIAGILSDQPDNVTALLARASFNYIDGNFNDVVADARVALRKDPQSDEALLYLARAHSRMGDVLLAQDAYQQLLELNPQHPTALNELAASLLDKGDIDGAEELWRRRPEVTDSRVGLIRVFLARGDLSGAEGEARSLIEVDESEPTGYVELGQVLQAAGKDREAAQTFREALERAPESVAALQGIVAALIKTDGPGEAIDYLKGYTAKFPERPYARFLLANTYELAGNRDMARQLHESLIAEQALGAEPYLELAAMHEPASAERIAELVRGVAAYPEDIRLSLFLAQEYQQAGQVEMALEAYEAAFAVNNDNDLLVNNFASLLLDSHDDPESVAKALDIAKRFRDSQRAPFLDTLGWAYYRNGDYANAVRYLESAVAIAGQIPILRYHLGMAYLASGNRVNGRQELETAISISGEGFPGLDEAKTALEELKAGS